MKQPSDKREYSRPETQAVLLEQKTQLLESSPFGMGGLPGGMVPEGFGN